MRLLCFAVAFIALTGGACTRSKPAGSRSADVSIVMTRTASTGPDGLFLGPESGFAAGHDDRLFAVAFDGGGRTIAVGRSRDALGQDHALLLVLGPPTVGVEPGAVARGFGAGVAFVVGGPLGPRLITGERGTSDMFFDVAVDAQGRILAVGQAGVAGRSKALIARFLPDGRFDTTFGDVDGRGPARKGFAIGMGDEFLDDAFVPVPPEELTPDERFTAVTIDARGRILAAGMTGDRGKVDKGEVAACGRLPFDPCPARFSRALVVRWTDAGVLDTSFHKTGYALGRSSRSSWSGAPREAAFGVAGLPGGGLVAGGFAHLGDPDRRVPLLVRLTENGSPDEAFAGGRGFLLGEARARAGGSREEIHAVTVDPNGKIVVSGCTSDEAGHARTLIARYLASGAPDTTFAEAGFAIDERPTRPEAPSTASLDDHEVVVTRGPGLLFAAASGALDPTFGQRSIQTASVALERARVDPTSHQVVAVGARSGRAAVLRVER